MDKCKLTKDFDLYIKITFYKKLIKVDIFISLTVSNVLL